MKNVRAALVVVCLAVSASSASATPAFDTYVSSTGMDLNNVLNQCARPTPCATFAGAFAIMPLSNGVIHVIDQGAYGPVTITHGVTIDGGGFATTYTNAGDAISSNPQFQINAGPSDIVTIMNIIMSGKNVSAAAIAVTSVGGLHVQHCTFSGFTLSAIDFVATGANLEMTDVTISDIQSGQGVYVLNARASLDNVHIHHTQTGVLAAGSSPVSIRRSTFNANAEAVAAAYGPTAELHVDDCMMTNNQWAVVVSNGATAYVSRSSLSNNFISALFNDGSSFLVSYGDNRLVSNASDGAFTSTATMK
jgi:hypothetical protein